MYLVLHIVVGHSSCFSCYGDSEWNRDYIGLIKRDHHDTRALNGLGTRELKEEQETIRYCRQTNRQTDRQTDKQTDRQTDRQTDKEKVVKKSE